MRKGELIGRILEIAVVFLIICAMLKGLASISDDNTCNVYASSSYNIQAAVNYAETWWSGRNPVYHDYGDYDCANFVSQCLIAGGLDLSTGPGVDAWGCIPSVTNLDYNLRHYQNTQYQVGGSEPLWLVKGDPIIFYSNDGTHHHSAFGIVGDASNYWLGNAHSINCYHKPISWFLSDPNLDYCVYFHIKGGTPGQPPTEAPTHILPHNGDTDVSLTPTFQWGSVANADYYALYISKPPYGASNLVFDSEEDYGPIYGTSFKLPSGILSEGVTYRWNMSAWNGAGRGPFSGAWSFTTAGVCPHSCWDRSALSGNELAGLVRNHFPLGAVAQTGESKRVTAYAIAKAESGGNPSACGPVGEIGLWQIHPPSHPSYDECLLFEEDYNANAAKEISSNGNNWNPWCTYEETCYCSVCTGTYRNHLTEARKHFYPKVTSLSVSSTSINLGEDVRIYYSVSDDVGLSRVELWRTTDKNGVPDESNWAWIKEISISGTAYSGYFTDTPTPSGIYWYGIHVTDNSGAPEAWNCERNSRTGNWPGVYGPDSVEVTPPQRTITFYTNPTAGSTITFDGSTYNNGQSTTKIDDSYSVSANPASNYEFDHWTTTGGVSVLNPNSQSTTATVSGDGSIKAWFNYVPPQRTITFYTDPTNGGTVTFDGSTYNNGQSTTKIDDSYSVSANPASNYEFDHWTTTGGVSVSNPNSQSTTATVSGDGSIKAWFNYIPPQRTITFYTDPTNGGTITFDGSAYSNGQSTTKPDDTYPVSANPAPNHEFDHWSTTDGVSITNPDSQSTIATVSGDGSIKAWFTASAATVDISVVLQGGSRPLEGWEVPITIKFFSQGADVMTDIPLEQLDLTTTKSASTATCQCTVAPGTYDITAVSEHTLTNLKRNVVISSPSTAVDMGILLEGNANDDSIINISDFGILAVSYMCTVSEPCYDARADFDRNGIINISDFGLLAVNYMKMSPINVSG